MRRVSSEFRKEEEEKDALLVAHIIALANKALLVRLAHVREELVVPEEAFPTEFA